MADTDILVAGSGPAGVLAAIGLVRAGHRVVLVTSPRPSQAVEGLSERVLDALDRAGCRHALAAIGAEVRREASWNGTTASANREWVADRGRLDAALLDDASSAGVEVRAGHIRAARTDAKGCRLELGEGTILRARLLVEARGRRAPGARVRGPATTALTCQWQGAPRRARTAVAPFREGWAWLASTGDGRASLQIAVSSEHARLPRQRELSAFYLATAARISEAAEWLGHARPGGPVTARHAGTSRAAAPIEARLIRIGDAALALDPLSGHGVFEAIASATAAVPAINTLLARPEAADLARAFYDERVRLAFERFARIGRDFYALERRWPEAAFWAERSQWPDDLPAHRSPLDAPPVIASRPVVVDGFIESRPVVITADHPRGVWQVAGVPLALLLDWWRARVEPSAHDAGRRLQRPPDDIRIALAWLRYRRLLD